MLHSIVTYLKPCMALALFVMAVLGISSCSSPLEEGLRFGLSSAPINLDPRYATDAASSRINRLIYQQLVDFDESYKPVPALANWQQLSARHYRFQLQSSARFHNGEALTAYDVKATY